MPNVGVGVAPGNTATWLDQRHAQVAVEVHEFEYSSVDLVRGVAPGNTRSTQLGSDGLNPTRGWFLTSFANSVLRAGWGRAGPHQMAASSSSLTSRFRARVN